ncbi:EAL domain-containing protein [Tepidibacillus marianensis]|uniref:putative bifunctional diguanylate cyclase/phosphodiesterase n=1 Tax=Tepidibacillus marianensis TaxID=3131995 RepID=UPI0030CF3AA0
MDLNTGEITGVEALLRWFNSDLGFVSPAEFIPLAEETGFIVPIGKWVLKTACAQNMEWREKGFPVIRVAVNISVRQLQQQNLVDVVSQVLDETGLPAECLELEITESIALENLDYNINILNQLREMGIRISLDDFGTGYSSLSYLKQLPIDHLKIDRTFVQNLATEQKNKAIANAIIYLAHDLHLHVIAEGVETEEQLNFLRMHSCDYYQGYLFCRPIPSDEIEEILDQRAGYSVI